jgi:hypothetical protein
LSFLLPVFQVGSNLLAPFTILAIAIGIAGLAILILFAKRKI